MYANRICSLFSRKSSCNWLIRNRYCSQFVSPSKKVWISQSEDIFVNLAFEEWIFKNVDFRKENILMVWKNLPCVVIGRHQNPWSECNKPLVNELGIQIARRGSGGGTVYHDTGNLCFTFFSERKNYDRPQNLKLIKNSLESIWPLDLSINCRDDLLLNDTNKISGSAARLERDKAFHHFTLLIDVNKSNLKNVLNSELEGLDTKATRSVKSDVLNLADVNADISVDKVIDVISHAYVENSSNENLIRKIDPIKEFHEEITPYMDMIRSSDWIFCKTPDFVIKQERFIIGTAIDMTLQVKKGVIKNLLFTNPDMKSEYFNLMNDLDMISDQFKGVAFHRSKLHEICHNLKDLTETSDVDREFDLGIAIDMRSLVIFFQLFENVLLNV